MIFDVFEDTGSTIRGTVIPDSFTAVPKILIYDGDTEVGGLHTTGINHAIRELGLHESGSVDFVIDDQVLPELINIENLTLALEDSGLVIYRRFLPGMVRQKYVRLETQLLPSWRLDDGVKDRFQMYYRQIERLGRSATMQLFLLSQESIYLSGRIFFPNFGHADGKGFKVIYIARNPYEELAEQLLVLKNVGMNRDGLLADRDLTTYRHAISYASELPLDGDKELKRFLKRMPSEVAVSLSNPVVRHFSAANMDELPSQGALGRTLQTLADAAFVGLREDPVTVEKAFRELFGEITLGSEVFPVFPKVRELATLIEEFGSCDAMMELDLELYHHVVHAYEKSA